jgi:hypothetical protein
MKGIHLIHGAAVALTATAIFAQPVLAGGEPKSQSPFTRPVVAPAGQVATQTMSRSQPAIQGERKNDQPFTRSATVVIVSGGGFDWTDGGIGAAAGVGLALAGIGTVLLARKSPRPA